MNFRNCFLNASRAPCNCAFVWFLHNIYLWNMHIYTLRLSVQEAMFGILDSRFAICTSRFNIRGFNIHGLECEVTYTRFKTQSSMLVFSTQGWFTSMLKKNSCAQGTRFEVQTSKL